MGIARVGNSPKEYFLIPDPVNSPFTDPQNFRDNQGRIKRKEVRFRLFGANKEAHIIKELTAADGDIT